MKLTGAHRAVRLGSVAGRLFVAACTPGAAAAQDGPALQITAAPPSEWLRDGEYLLAGTATQSRGLWRVSVGARGRP